MEAKLCFIGHGLMENRSGLIVDARLTGVSGHAERLATRRHRLAVVGELRGMGRAFVEGIAVT